MSLAELLASEFDSLGSGEQVPLFGLEYSFDKDAVIRLQDKVVFGLGAGARVKWRALFLVL